MGAEDDAAGVLAQLAERYKSIKFGAGVVGKTSYVVLGLVIAWTVILFRLNGNQLQDTVLLLAGFLATCFGVWWINKTHRFAEKNPSLALLEGAQLLEYQRFEAQAKGLLQSSPANSVMVQGPTSVTPNTDPAKPDP